MSRVKGVSRLFSSGALKDIADGDFDFVLRVASLYRDELGDLFRLRDVIEVCYLDLSANYRGEYFFKNTVAERILIGRHSLNTATMISEFRVGSSKADCVLINGNTICYEIKSEYDNLRRLPEQLISYETVFDLVYVVTSKEHVEQILDMSPRSIGVLKLVNGRSLSKVRDAKKNNFEISASELIKSLRVEEYKKMAEILAGSTPDASNTEIFSVCQDVFERANRDDLKKAFSKVLKESRRVDGNFVSMLPRSLLMAGISYKMPKNKWASLLENLDKKFTKDLLCISQY